NDEIIYDSETIIDSDETELSSDTSDNESNGDETFEDDFNTGSPSIFDEMMAASSSTMGPTSSNSKKTSYSPDDVVVDNNDDQMTVDSLGDLGEDALSTLSALVNDNNNDLDVKIRIQAMCQYFKLHIKNYGAYDATQIIAESIGKHQKIKSLMYNEDFHGIPFENLDGHERPDAMAALGKYCHNLEELSLKKEIACSGEILLSIVKNCPKLFKLEIEGKDYNNQTLYKILEHCPNILTLNINQCMNITDELLIATYKLCTNLKKLSFKKIFEITENFVISTLNHFPRTSTIVISNIDRMFQSSIEVDGEKIFLVANLCDVDIHRIIDFYSIKEDGLQELTFIDDIMNALENLKDLQIFTVKFSSVDHEAFFENDKEQLVKYCPKLKAIKWHFQKIYIKDNNHVLK
ncbi:15358_t:CDS:2, partial [Entrophospora sp. SA101]